MSDKVSFSPISSLHDVTDLMCPALFYTALPCPCCLPLPWSCPALPCPNLSCYRRSYSATSYLLRPALPSGPGLCHHSALPSNVSFWAALPATCPAPLCCDSKLCVSCQAVLSTSVLPTGHDSSSCTISEAPGSCADCAPGPSALQAPASQLVGKLPTPISSVLLSFQQQADVVTIMQCAGPCCLHSGTGS